MEGHLNITLTVPFNVLYNSKKLIKHFCNSDFEINTEYFWIPVHSKD